MKTFDLHDQQINQGSIIEDIHNNSIKMQKKEIIGEATQPMKKSMYVDIVEQPASKGLRFRYECEGRSAGCIPGVNTTNENKTYPTIRVAGYKGRAVVVVSCVTVEPPYRPHPHSLVGKEGCKKGVCTLELDPSTMTCCFSSLGIQCVKRKEIESALQLRQQIRVDPFQTGFTHKDNQQSIDLNSVRLCFQVFLEGTEKGAFTFALRPVVSDPIYDKKSRSDLTICRMTECSASVTGGKEIMLFCDKVSKDDIQIQFYEESNDGVVTWRALGEFQPTDVHKQYGICFRTPKYKVMEVSQSVKANIQLYRPSDGATSLPRNFYFLPIEGPSHSKPKRLKTDITEMLLDKRHLSTKALNGGGGSLDSPSIFYIPTPNGLPASAAGSINAGIIAMPGSTSSQPLSTPNVLPNEFNNNFTNPLANISSVKYEPTMPASLTNVQPFPVVPPPGQQQPTYLLGSNSKVSPTQTLPTMQVVQTNTINPNGVANDSSIQTPIQQYQAQIPQPSLQQEQHKDQDMKNVASISCLPMVDTTSGWNQEMSNNILTDNIAAPHQTLVPSEVQHTNEKPPINDPVSPATDIDIGELYDDVMQCVYDDVQADEDAIDLIFDKPPTPPERIKSCQPVVEQTSTLLPESIERPLPEKPPSKPSMMSRFGKKGFLSGKGKDKASKKKQAEADSSSTNATDSVDVQQQQIGGPITSTEAMPNNKTNLPKNSSVPFFQRLFNRSKSQTEEELNFQNQLQSDPSIISDINNGELMPSVPSQVSNNEGISDISINNEVNASETLKANDTCITNENTIFEILDENLTVNDLQS